MNNIDLHANTIPEIINISEEKDRNYWTDRLGITPEVLKSAIRATKCVALKDISNYLDQHNIKHLA